MSVQAKKATVPAESTPSLKPKKHSYTSEDIFKYVNLAVTTILAFCVKGFLQFRSVCETKGLYVFSVDSLIWVAAGFGFFYITKYSWNHLMRNKIYKLINLKYQGEVRDWKTIYVLKLSYDCLFYSFTTVMAFVFFRNEYWFPSIVGGCGECAKIYKDYPNWPAQKRTELEIYFLFQLGVHAFSVFQMTILKRKTERKYHEYLLHHFIAVSLILFSMMSNQIVAGAMILIVHDMSDIIMSGARAQIETVYENKVTSGILYFSLLFVWVFCRIFVFPFCLLANVWVNVPLPTDIWYMINFQYKYLLSMACVLYVMHLYWTFYLMKVGVNSLMRKKMVNDHEKMKD